MARNTIRLDVERPAAGITLTEQLEELVPIDRDVGPERQQEEIDRGVVRSPN